MDVQERQYPTDTIGQARRPEPGEGVGMPPTPSSANKRPQPSRRTSKIIGDALRDFEKMQQHESKNRKQAIEALKFKTGDQWPADIKAARVNQKRPALTINKIPTFLRQITNPQRENRPAIHVSPEGDRADKMAARAFGGLIRRIEYDSAGDIAIDTAFESAVDIGWGYWRFLTRYVGPDTFNQEIVWARVRNTMTVYGDPDSQQPDGSDWKKSIVTELIDRDEFKVKHPKANPCSWSSGGVGENMREWITEKKVRVAEYWRIEKEKRRLVMLDTGSTAYYDELPQMTLDLISSGAIHILEGKDREVEVEKVMCYKMTALEILEEYEWLGKWIPIVKVTGNETDVQGEVKVNGAIEDMMDPQRMKNYWATKKTEAAALTSNAPWVMEEGQLEGHEDEWKSANTVPRPVLVYKGTNLKGERAPPPKREPFAGPPQSLIEAEQHSEQDMMGTSGIRFDATKQERVNDESGKALTEIRGITEVATYHYHDNLARSLRFSGKILIDLIPKVIDTKRIETILNEDGTTQTVMFDPDARHAYAQVKPVPGQPAQPNAPTAVINPNIGDYGVRATIGPAYATRRIEASRSLKEFLKIYPNAGPRIADLILKAEDFPMSEEAAARLMPPELAMQEVKNLPPEAQALVGNLMQQLKGLTTERMQMIKELTDERADRAVKMEKIERDFEAKMANVAVNYEKLIASSIERAMGDLGNAVQQLRERLEAGSTPPSGTGATLTGGSTTGQPPALAG